MKTSESAKHYTDGLITLVVFGVFAACTILALLAGAGIYRRLNVRDDSVYAESTISQYLTNKVRSAGSPDSVSVNGLGCGSALTISEVYGDAEYITYIYEDGGYIKELFTSSDMAPEAETGESVMPCDGLEFKLDNGLLTVNFNVSGEAKRLTVNVRGREKAE